MNFADFEKEAERLVTRAKIAKEKAKDLRDDGDFKGAINVLAEIVDELTTSPLAPKPDGVNPATEAEKKLATQLADCLGMLGGNYRRIGQLTAAQDAFERGRHYEESSRLDVASSYNLVNAITLPLESSDAIPADLAGALRNAVTAIKRQVRGVRRTDRWAWADLAECQLLLKEHNEALSNYKQVRTLGDEETIISIVYVLQRLRESLKDKDSTAAAHIDDVSRYLNDSD